MVGEFVALNCQLYIKPRGREERVSARRYGGRVEGRGSGRGRTDGHPAESCRGFGVANDDAPDATRQLHRRAFTLCRFVGENALNNTDVQWEDYTMILR